MDKTPWIARLLDEGGHYFLSRPRRFGKSLLLDTMKELFEGNEPLFRGLAIHDRWDMAVRAGGRIWLFEFKVIEQSGEGSAMTQFVERRYAEKYAARGEPVRLVGVEFSSRTRNVERFEVRDAGA